MAKIKKEHSEKLKAIVKNKIQKRKSIKHSAAIKPKLKKLKTTGLAVVIHKTPKKFIVPSTVVPSVINTENEFSDSPNIPENYVKAPVNPVERRQIQNGVSALYQYIEKTAVGKTELFDDEQPIFLQITCIKVPKVPSRQVRLALHHTLLSDSSEVCLIVKDVGRPKKHEETVEYFEKLLQDKGITGIKTILPLHQFKTEYGNQFELKRKFLGLYDHFLVDARVSGYVTKLLGKIFIEKRKLPTPIKMEVPNLKDHIDKALRKTIMTIHSKGDSNIVQVGHTKMKEEDVFENIVGIVDKLAIEYPGGLDNVRSLGIKTATSLTIPIYLTLKNKSTVNVPVIHPKRPKKYRAVEGELTTFINRNVTVFPSGDVIVHKRQIKNTQQADKKYVQDVEAKESLVLLHDEQFSVMGSEKQEDEEGDDEKVFINNIQKKRHSEGTEENRTESKNKNGVKDTEALNEKEEDTDMLDRAEEMYLNQYEQEQVNAKKSKKTKSVKSNPKTEAAAKKNKIKGTEEKARNKIKPANSKTTKKKISRALLV